MDGDDASPRTADTPQRTSMFAEVVTSVVSHNGGVAKVFASDSDYFHAEDSGLDREMLRKRVGLEYKMLSMLPRLVFFIVCFGLFIAIQQVEYDPTNFSGIHLRLNDHFHLDNVYGIRQIPELIEYLDTFVISNAA
ncbi:cdtl-7 [Symbiodinium microadriaticum]|nr:cdtl-7 [Symbiodinium microadriaticum]